MSRTRLIMLFLSLASAITAMAIVQDKNAVPKLSGGLVGVSLGAAYFAGNASAAYRKSDGN